MTLNWRQLQQKLNSLTEKEIWELIESELNGKKRVSFIERLHMRACVLRTTRERLDLLRRATT